MGKAMNNETLWKSIQLFLVGGGIAYGTYVNAKQVPAIVEKVSENTVKIAVLESQMIDIKNSLGRIESLLNRRR